MSAERGDATELVVARIRASIRRGDLKSGDQLPPERELATRYGVSRPSVRSALKTLSGMGVVQIRRGAGTFIVGGPPILHSEPLSYLAALHGFTPRQMFESRLVLEVETAALAAQRATPDQVVELSDQTTAMFASLDDPDAFLLHDIRFHRAVGAASDNPVLAALVEMVASIFQQVRQQSIRGARDLKLAAEEHRAIYQAIRAKDPARARTAMREHLLRAGRTQMIEKMSPGTMEASEPAVTGGGAPGESNDRQT
jgi:GntR family transcriptional repressor for pyruvate dehydrogenase complex